MKKKLYRLALLVGFFAILIVPLATFNRENGKKSELENRTLATFPDFFNSAGHLNKSVRSDFENWLNDNIGFRSVFVKLTTRIKLKILYQSPNERVQIGKQGWYFYTPENNIGLAASEDALTEIQLQTIADHQQKISDWYEAQGITYVLVLTAAKTTVYPEYIASGDYSVGETDIDRLAQYLESHTTVNVVNTKTAMLEGKTKEQMYLKTDSHWTHQGAYRAYLAIADRLNSLGIRMKDFPVTFIEGIYHGEFSAMLGDKSILGDEPMLCASWTATSEAVTSGDLYDTIRIIRNYDRDSRLYGFLVYRNDSAENGTLLIYGDSQWLRERNLPQWHSESFQTVVSTRFRSVSQRLEKVVKPNTVIYSCSERNIKELLLRNLTIPEIRAELPDLAVRTMITEEDYGSWIPNMGILLENVNGKEVKTLESIPLDTSSQAVSMSGWAVDFNYNYPFTELYVKVGDVYIRCETGLKRESVANKYGIPPMLQCGFRAEIPTELFDRETVEQFEIIGVSADGRNLCEPAVYVLDYTDSQENEDPEAESPEPLEIENPETPESSNIRNEAIREGIENGWLPALSVREMVTEEEYGEWIPPHGIRLEKVNDAELHGETEISFVSKGDTVTLSGWAVDFVNDAPFRDIYIKVGETFVQCETGLKRDSIAEHYGKEEMLNVGFRASFPLELLQDGTVEEISFICVSADGQYLYTPAVYTLSY